MKKEFAKRKACILSWEWEKGRDKRTKKERVVVVVFGLWPTLSVQKTINGKARGKNYKKEQIKKKS